MFKFVLVLFWRKLKVLNSLYKFYSLIGYIPPTDCIINDIRNIKIGSEFTMGNSCKLFSQDANSSIEIGNRVSLNYGVSLNADGNGFISIGDNTIIGPNTVLRASNHKFNLFNVPIRDQGHVSGKIILRNNVWVGANVVILPNTTIGSNSIIGAGSVVTKDVEESTIVAGVPAVPIKKRGDKL